MKLTIDLHPEAVKDLLDLGDPEHLVVTWVYDRLAEIVGPRPSLTVGNGDAGTVAGQASCSGYRALT